MDKRKDFTVGRIFFNEICLKKLGLLINTLGKKDILNFISKSYKVTGNYKQLIS